MKKKEIENIVKAKASALDKDEKRNNKQGKKQDRYKDLNKLLVRSIPSKNRFERFFKFLDN